MFLPPPLRLIVIELPRTGPDYRTLGVKCPQSMTRKQRTLELILVDGGPLDGARIPARTYPADAGKLLEYQHATEAGTVHVYRAFAALRPETRRLLLHYHGIEG